MSRLNRQQNEPFGIKHDFFCVDLVVTPKPKTFKEDFLDRNPSTEYKSTIELNSLFSKDTNRGNAGSPDIVAVIGTAGSGKSTLSQEVVYSWAKDELFKSKFGLVFHLRCRDLAELSDNKFTLEELLRKSHDGLDMDIMKKIQSNIEKTLIVIDGLDEFPAWIKSAASKNFITVMNSTDASEPHMLIHNLLKGNILPGVKLLVTSRPIKHLDILTCDRYAQIQGFSDSSIRQCISSICGEDMKILDKIMDHIESHRDLYNLCVIPFMCVLLGVVAKERLSETDTLDIDNMTQLLIRAVRHLYTRRGSKEVDCLYSSSLNSNLCKLACLAYSMTMETTLFFNGGDLKTHDITDDIILHTGLLEITKEKSVVNIGPKESCSFIHKLVQEFLTAVHICLTWEQQDIDKINQLDYYEMDLDNVRLFIGGLLGDEELGHDLLYKLITNNSNKQRNFSDDAKKFYHTMLSQNTNDNELSKIQSICCAHQGMNASLLQEATEDIETWESLEYDGGEFSIQTHQIASLAWFLKETQTVTDLW